MTQFNNMAQSERESLIDSLRNQAADDTGNYVNVTGDTMTGNLAVPTLAATSTVSLSGVLDVSGAVNLRSTATITGTLDVTGATNLRSTAAVTGVFSTTAGSNLNSNATLTTPVIAQHSTLGGATIAPIRVIASTASQSFFDFRGAVISTASINISAGQMAGAVQVWISGEGGPAIGYLPIFKGVI